LEVPLPRSAYADRRVKRPSRAPALRLWCSRCPWRRLVMLQRQLVLASRWARWGVATRQSPWPRWPARALGRTRARHRRAVLSTRRWRVTLQTAPARTSLFRCSASPLSQPPRARRLHPRCTRQPSNRRQHQRQCRREYRQRRRPPLPRPRHQHNHQHRHQPTRARLFAAHSMRDGVTAPRTAARAQTGRTAGVTATQETSTRMANRAALPSPATSAASFLRQQLLFSQRHRPRWLP
jgi:hypothetical protein